VRFKGTIFLTVVLILLGGYLLWYEIPQERKRTEAEERSKRVLDIADDKVTGLVIQIGKDEIELERHPDAPDQKWEVVRPIAGPGNDATASFALSSLERLQFSRELDENPSSLKPFGLDPPDFSVTVVLNRKEVERIDFGSNSPVGNEIFAKRVGDKRLLLVDAAIRSELKKGLKDWRRGQILPENSRNVKELTLTFPKRTLSLALVGDQWRIQRPSELPGDMAAVNGFLNSLFNLEANDFVEAKKEEKTASFGSPYLKVDVKILETHREVSFYKPPGEPGTVYALTTLEDPIYKIRPTDVGFLEADVVTFRDKSLIHVANQSEVSEIEVTRGQNTYALLRKEGGWVLSDGSKVDESKVLHLLAELQTAQVDQFLDSDRVRPVDLDHPETKVILRNKEKKSLAELSLGKEEKGKLYAKSSTQPTPFLVRIEFLAAIPTREGLAVKENPPATPKPAPSKS